VNQHVDHSLVAITGGAHQRGPAVAVLLVDLRAVPQQQLDHSLAAFSGSVRQCGDAFAVLHVDLCAVLQ